MTTRIYISDVGTGSTYTLDGTRLTMTVTGGCTDVLCEQRIELSEDMSDLDIERIVYDAWCDGYEGDPVANDLRVAVERETEVSP